jgi:hypothetical protein
MPATIPTPSVFPFDVRSRAGVSFPGVSVPGVREGCLTVSATVAAVDVDLPALLETGGFVVVVDAVVAALDFRIHDLSPSESDSGSFGMGRPVAPTSEARRSWPGFASASSGPSIHARLLPA